MRYLIWLVFLGLLATGCRTVPMTERSQLMLSFESHENAMGATAYVEYKEKEKPSTNARQQEVLKRVGNAIKDVAGDTGFAWEFNVIESRTINAWCLPGGKVAVYTAMMKKFKNEAEMACVVAHEVAHAIARHGGERMSWNYLKILGSLGISAIGNDTAQTVYGIGAEYGVMLPYSRSHETEADLIGLVLMAKAGYNPHAAVDFWKRFGGDSSSSILNRLTSTHPCDEKRVADLSNAMEEAMKHYLQSPNQKGYGVPFNNGIPEADASDGDVNSSSSPDEVYITI